MNNKPSKTIRSDQEQQQLLETIREEHRQRQTGYREQALKLFPHVCARCTRELEGKKLKELTVHHKDHNHDNNPSDGNNWELLCLYCHDHEHTRSIQEARDSEDSRGRAKPTLSHSPFAALASLKKSGQ